MSDQDPRDAFLDSLRQVADFLAEHPEVPEPSCMLGDHQFFIFLYGEDARQQLVTIARAMGRAEKYADGDKFGVRRQFGAITLLAQANRAAVCERVVVGTHEEEVEEPDEAAVAALPKLKRIKVVEDVTWVCSPLLADEPALPASSAPPFELGPVEDDEYALAGGAVRAQDVS